METGTEGAANRDSLAIMLESAQKPGPGGEAHLLVEAFQMFTQASNSLESAFRELQERTRRLSLELAAKNRELKKSLAEKHEMQSFLATILESLPCGVLVLDAAGDVSLCNPTAASILGRSVRAGRGSRRRRREGVQEYLGAWAARANGNSEVEIPFDAEDGRKVLASTSTPLKGRAGSGGGTLHIMRDITAIKTLEEQSKRSERLSAMGEMAVQLAHEIRNPLGSIELFASLLEKELPSGSDAGRWAENIRTGSRSLNNIVSNMLHFANPLAPQFEEVDLHDLIGEILRFAEPILQQREVQVHTRLESRCGIVIGDRELLKQVILNLVLNSLQAMPSQGSLTLGTRDVGQATVREPGAGSIEITVSDTGLGIPAENLERIFDPFFTTNRNGTGLGLSVVYQIVKQHSGLIEVASEVNVGTTFTLTLPGTDCAAGAA